MDSLLGFSDASTVDDQSIDYKLVPWLNWDEWNSVRTALFSSSHDSVAFALRKIYAWRSRGCLPVSVEVTASIVEVQQTDPYFRADLGDQGSESDEMLAMLYSMAVMRLVNGLVEKTRKKKGISIAVAAEAIKLPRMLIDIRHEGSHRDLPSVQLLRLASTKALNWLKSYYWDPQVEMIPFQGRKSAKSRKEVKSRLRELATILKEKQNCKLGSSQDKRKRCKHYEQLCGRSKIFPFMAMKIKPAKYIGFKKAIVRVLKNLVLLYSFSSSEVVSVLLGLLLNISNPYHLMDHPDTCLAKLSLDAMQNAFDDWKPVILMFCKKEPELILNLLTAVLDIAGSREARENDVGAEHDSLARYDAEVHKVELLSSLFSWLVEILVGMKDYRCLTEKKKKKDSRHEVSDDDRGNSSALPKATLIGLLRRCLLISRPGSDQISRSALLLAQMIGSSSIIEKLKKLSMHFHSLECSADSAETTSECLVHQEEHNRLAAQKLKSLELYRVERENASRHRGKKMETIKRWTVVESWKPCPIGMLPGTLGSSGRLPVLECNATQNTELNSTDRKYEGESRKCSGKREASNDLDFDQSYNCSVKRMRGTMEDDDAVERDGMDIADTCRDYETICRAVEANEPGKCDVDDAIPSDGIKGRLWIGGVLARVGEEELQAIKSAIRILL